MEKWSWIRIRNLISTKIKLVLEVHPLLPPTKFGGDPWTRSWDILRTKTVRADTCRWSQDLAAYGAQVKMILENLLPAGLLVSTNLFIPSRFSTTYTNFDNCCLRYIAMCGRNVYIGAHLHSLGPKLLQWNFLQICHLSIRSGAHKLFRRFFDFSKFLNAISRKLWRHPAPKISTT